MKALCALCSFFLLLFFFLTSTLSTASKPVVLPLQTMKISTVRHTTPASKLLFRYNYSLVVPLMVGTPPQQINMVVDTGSELTWVQCQPSPELRTPIFNPSKSSSYRPLPCTSGGCAKARDLSSPPICDSKKLCHFAQTYADGSTSEGTIATEAVSLGDLTLPSLVIGCTTTSYSSTKDDQTMTGLIGMNRGAVSFVSQVGSPRFSYCISDKSSSGVLVIGESDPVWASAALNYTPFVGVSMPLPYFDRVAYSVQLVGVRVAGKVLPLPKTVFVPDHTGAGQTMVDSGTQFTMLLGPVYTALKNEYLQRTRGLLRVYEDKNYVFQGAHDLCYRWSGRVLPALPPVVLMFNGAEMAVTGERLLYKVPDRAGIYCFTFGNSDLVPVEAYIIGHHHQQNMWVEYDIERSRLGFAPARCDLARQRLVRG